LIKFHRAGVVAAMILFSIVGSGTEIGTQDSSSVPKASGHCQTIESVFEKLGCFVTLADASDDPSLCGESSIDWLDVRFWPFSDLRRYAVLTDRMAGIGKNGSSSHDFIGYCL